MDRNLDTYFADSASGLNVGDCTGTDGD